MFSKTSQNSNPQLIALIEDIKANHNRFIPFADQLYNYIPNYTNIILKELLSIIVSILRSPTSSREIVSCLISLLLKMVTDYDPTNPQTNPYKFFEVHPLLIDALLSHTYPLNLVLNELIQYFFANLHSLVSSFISGSPSSLIPLIKTISETKNVLSGSLLVQLSNDSLNICIPYMIPYMKKFPLPTFLALASKSIEIRSIFTDTELISWILSFRSISSSDFKQAVKYFPCLWSSTALFALILNVIPNIPISQLSWMHEMPFIDHTLSSDLTKEIANSLLSPPFEYSSFIRGRTTIGHITTSCESFIFLRLFALSFSEPNNVPIPCIDLIEHFIFDSNEWICCAAQQLIINWILKCHSQKRISQSQETKTEQFSYVPKKSLIFLAAAGVYEKPKNALKCLYRAFLRAMACLSPHASTIISQEDELEFKEEMISEITNMPWCFSRTPKNLKDIMSIEVLNFGESISILGVINQTLGLFEEEENV